MAFKGKSAKKLSKKQPEVEAEDNTANYGKFASEYYVGADDNSDIDNDSEFDAHEDELERIESTRAKRTRDADIALDNVDSDEESDEDEDDDDMDMDGVDFDEEDFDGDEDEEDEDEEDVEDMISGELDDITASLLADRITEDPAELSASEAKKVVARDAQEFKSVLQEALKKLNGLKTSIMPLLEKITSGELKKSGRGVTYLEAKAQLILSYLINIAFYISLKARGQSVKDHPVVEELIYTKTLLEKLTSLDEKLAPQIDRIIARDAEAASVAAPRAAMLADGDEQDDDEDMDEDEEDDEEEFGVTVAGSDEEEEEESEDEEEDAKEVYKAPMRLAMESTGAHLTAKQRAEKDLQRAKERLRNSEAARLLREENDIAPSMVGGIENASLMRQMEKAQRTEEFELDTFNRVRQTKAQRKMDKKSRDLRGLMTGAGDMVDDLGDIADDIIHAANESRNGLGNVTITGKKGNTSAFGAFLNAATQAQKAAEKAAEAVKEGAEDLSAYRTIKRDRMHEMDEVEARRELEKADAERDAKTAEYRKKQKDRALKHLKPLKGDEMDREKDDDSDKRKITYQMDKNKGLIRSRAKTDGNARVHNRQKYERRLKLASKPQAREGTSSGRYDGESSIRTDLIKSKKLSN